MKDRNVSFDEILTSPLLRAEETAEIINEYCGTNRGVTVTDLLKPEGDFNKLIKFINEFKNSTKIALVGHEPFLSTFASYCLAKNKRSFLNLKKGGALLLEIDKKLTPGKCLLSWLLEPSQIVQEK